MCVGVSECGHGLVGACVVESVGVGNCVLTEYY